MTNFSVNYPFKHSRTAAWTKTTDIKSETAWLLKQIHLNTHINST